MIKVGDELKDDGLSSRERHIFAPWVNEQARCKWLGRELNGRNPVREVSCRASHVFCVANYAGICIHLSRDVRIYVAVFGEAFSAGSF